MGKEMRLQPVRKDRDLNNVGPGSYTPDVKPKQSLPKYSIGSRLKLGS
jgi:hypothetical protein